jgi:hypothetical protein
MISYETGFGAIDVDQLPEQPNTMLAFFVKKIIEEFLLPNLRVMMSFLPSEMESVEDATYFPVDFTMPIFQ